MDDVDLEGTAVTASGAAQVALSSCRGWGGNEEACMRDWASLSIRLISVTQHPRKSGLAYAVLRLISNKHCLNWFQKTKIASTALYKDRLGKSDAQSHMTAKTTSS